MITQVNFRSTHFIVYLATAPVLGFIASLLWISGGYNSIWPNIYWISFMLFIPVSFMLGQLLKAHAPKLAYFTAVISIVGAISCAGHMFLLRFNAALPHHGKRNFADVLMNAMDKDFIALLTYIPGLLFPVSFVVFGIGLLRVTAFNKIVSLLLITFGILFWLGNAGESDVALLSCYFIGIITFGYLANSMRNLKKSMTPIIAE